VSLEGATVLLTGGAGFIGSHLATDLVDQGARVLVYDNFSCGRWENLSHLEGRVEVICADILDYPTLLEATCRADFVSHQAAQLEIFRSTDDPLADLEINTVGTLNVLKAAKAAGVRKVINASSACIYGQVSGATPETHLPVPNWAYGVSKLAAERYGTIYSQYQGLPVVSLRYSIVYGEREWYRRVLTVFLKRALSGQSLVVFGDGSQVRDYLYVGDLVRMHRLCLEHSIADGKSYNVGTGIGTTVVELAQAVKTASGRDVEVTFEDVAEGAFSRLVPDKKRNAAELKVMLLDCALARMELGWSAEVPLVEGLRREWDWLSANPSRWDRIRYTEVAG
jgi:UDP-glucose 4-epimerase